MTLPLVAVFAMPLFVALLVIVTVITERGEK